MAIPGLALVATATATAAPTSSLRAPARAVKGCITVTATIPVGRLPFGVTAGPKTNTAYVANSDSNTVSVISGRTNTVTTTIPVGNFLQGVAADTKTNTIYVTNAGTNRVSVINGQTNTVTATIPRGHLPAWGRGEPEDQHHLRDQRRHQHGVGH